MPAMNPCTVFSIGFDIVHNQFNFWIIRCRVTAFGLTRSASLTVLNYLIIKQSGLAERNPTPRIVSDYGLWPNPTYDVTTMLLCGKFRLVPTLPRGNAVPDALRPVLSEP